MSLKFITMERFETSLLCLLDEIAGILPPADVKSQRWKLIGKGRQQLVPFRDERCATISAYMHAYSDVRSLPSCSICEEVFDNDPTLQMAGTAMGYWGTFDMVLQRVLTESAIVRRNRIRFDKDRARAVIEKLRHILTADLITFSCRARILGVDMAVSSAVLANGVNISRLTIQERNRRQHAISLGFRDFNRLSDTVTHPVELTFTTSIPVDTSKPQAIFLASNEANQRSSEAFDVATSTLLFASDHRLELGHREIIGGFMDHGVSFGLEARSFLMALPKGKLTKRELSTAARVAPVFYNPNSDRVLSRSLHRFILGRRRLNATDRLIDYVIAWETILLTTNSSPSTQELSYRFALNGSSLLYCVDNSKPRQWWFNLMQCAYKVRSSLVHGSTERSLEKALSEGGFLSVLELCDFLQESLRDSVLWLLDLDSRERPYRKKSGWLKLLWSDDRRQVKNR